MTAGLNDINNPDNNNMPHFKTSRGEEARQERQRRKERNTVLLATRFLCANQGHMPKCISTFDLQRLPHQANLPRPFWPLPRNYQASAGAHQATTKPRLAITKPPLATTKPPLATAKPLPSPLWPLPSPLWQLPDPL